MKVYLTEQEPHFRYHLEELKSKSIIPYNINSLNHKVNSKTISINSDLSLVNNISFFDYNLFPKNILKAYPQWRNENRKMQINDTIVQEIYVPPVNGLSLKILTGVRIKDIFLSDAVKGYSYETLHGHIEKGISIFKITTDRNIVSFTIETYSKPAISVVNIFSHFTSKYQDYCTTQALQHTKF